MVNRYIWVITSFSYWSQIGILNSNHNIYFITRIIDICNFKSINILSTAVRINLSSYTTVFRINIIIIKPPANASTPSPRNASKIDTPRR